MRSDLRKQCTVFREKDVRGPEGQAVPILSVDPPASQPREKKELIFRKKYATMEEVKTDLYRYIELFYNRKRLHSTLGYMRPVAYRLAFMQ